MRLSRQSELAEAGLAGSRASFALGATSAAATQNAPSGGTRLPNTGTLPANITVTRVGRSPWPSTVCRLCR